MQCDAIAHSIKPRKAMRGIFQRHATTNAVDLVPFRYQKFRQIRTVLSGDARD